MADKSYYEGVGHIVHISTGDTRRCDHCEQMIGGSNFSDSVNHYISAHRYKLLHVGAETSRDDDGNPWQMTVAVLGA